jgi:hypothetical protein
MLLLKTILGGILGVVLAMSAVAEPAIRPLSRIDAAAIRQAADDAALAAFRPVERPAYMIRYPVLVHFGGATLRPQARSAFLPRTRWERQPGNTELWTRVAMSAVESTGDLDQIIPRDIDTWCPAYARNSPELRRAFWVGMMSALAKHESTFNPRAVGGGDLWFGLLQIYPDTARRYGCRAQTGEALKNPGDNLACASRIMAVTVARDRAVAVFNGRWRGVAADWGPMTNRNKIAEMSAWTRDQSYCTPLQTLRPQARPQWSVSVSTMTAQQAE